jgi:hypothetical protein
MISVTSGEDFFPFSLLSAFKLENPKILNKNSIKHTKKFNWPFLNDKRSLKINAKNSISMLTS